MAASFINYNNKRTTSHVTLYAFKGTSLFMLLSMKGDHANGAVQRHRIPVPSMLMRRQALAALECLHEKV
jgi:hypothetical protein